MHTKTATLPITDDEHFPKHKPYLLTVGEYLRMDKAPVKKRSYWTVTIESGPLIRSPVTFYYIDEADAKALIGAIQDELDRL